MSMETPNLPGGAMSGLVASAVEYMVDAGQRSVLFLDIMRRRGDQYREHVAQTAPHVLQYAAELIIDGRKLDEPVNYALVRIIPPAGVEIDPERRPFIVVDPRAGHGPGIGGFKADSEIGVAMKAGHTCYFVGFLPEPMPGQTIERIARAEARFIEKVISLHPKADGKPCVIGNCQAGWAVMILASLRPELFGPLIIAGAPLAYWAGVHGKYPMRYSGGLLGGSWLTALTGDLGAGKFDGAWLVQNFENQNPSNTLWTKQYNVYSKVDTEADRYLEFERWWGGHVNLNAEEIQFIVDELFIGNNLAAGKIEMSDGQKVDLRNIRSPIVVFCSKGDNVTPPQQALDWILDCYADVDEIRAYGQTIVYTVHESIGHLGIFVSGGVAKKEHAEFSSNIDLIDVLPPGLYEATFEAKGEETTSSDLVVGQWVMRCEARTLDDIRAMGGNSPEDERRFATAKRISELNLAAYKKFVQPWIKSMVTPQMAETMRNLHPLRLQYEALSSHNPWMAAVQSAADQMKESRKPVSKDNPFLLFQEQMSKQIVHALDSWRDSQEALSEAIFLNVYGSPALQAAVGIDPKSEPSRRREMPPEHRAMLEKRIAELKSRIGDGGLREAGIRGLLYAGSVRGMVDERSLEALRNLRRQDTGARITLSEFKMLVREQFFMLLLDQEAALAAIPKLLPENANERRAAFAAIQEVLSASSEISGEVAKRLNRISELFGIDAGVASNVAPFDPKAKAS
ncbi:pimeloyl-ACP methyl ester carboxylesterase [Bradyrhizobium sp. USDA 4011]